MAETEADIVIIGSGMGGATMAAALAPTGRQIVILERGDHMPDVPETRDAKAIFADGRFRPDEVWETPDGTPFNPGNFYFVGGNSKMYGAVLIRYRAEDFEERQHLGGSSPAWPISYAALEPWYQMAEEMYRVRGDATQDPSEPHHSGTYPYPSLLDEPAIAETRRRLRKAGVTPSSLPLGVDIDRWLEGGHTPWDGHPDTNGGKMDAESVGLAEALRHPNVTLLRNTRVNRLETASDARIARVHFTQDGDSHAIKPKVTILSAGAVNSAALLLASANDNFPNGLANRSDMVGRRFMNHNCSALLALHPFRRNHSVYQKTLQFNDFYLGGGPDGAPLGNVQLLGKITTPILTSQAKLPRPVAAWLAARSVDWYVMSEDLPSRDSRVTLRNGRIVLDWKRSNWQAHEALVVKTKEVLRKAGFPILLSKAFDRRTPSHQCGTTVFGADRASSVLNLHCRAHDHPNLFVVDAGFLPTSAAVNPALTIAAMALRVAEHVKEAA
ncbi:FAD-dependent oxidoreductase [Shimia ponticola]|uniref:FAD-dependent oxidoreductase n=1 Tax=Shimia ponticola TaxID=2582893 RepID=UPI0011BEB4A9|nr:GMC family oxidoreductase [Shimia ponticola]